MNHVNETGGIGGDPIKLVTYDDGYKSDETVRLVKEILVKETPIAFIGVLGTANNEAIVKERAHRAEAWADLVRRGGPLSVPPKLLRELNIYGCAQGIWVDKTRTRSLTPEGTGITVGICIPAVPMPTISALMVCCTTTRRQAVGTPATGLRSMRLRRRNASSFQSS